MIIKESLPAISTSQHLPLLYTLGVEKKENSISFFTDKTIGGSITMTSVKMNTAIA